MLPETQIGTLQITFIDGKVISTEILKGGKSIMMVESELEAGVYLIRLTFGGVELVKRMVKYLRS